MAPLKPNDPTRAKPEHSSATETQEHELKKLLCESDRDS